MITKNIQAAREAAFASGLNPKTLSKSDEWEQASADDVRIVLAAAALSGAGAGKLVGVDSRTPRRWTGGERSIPYAAWCLLVHAARLGTIWE